MSRARHNWIATFYWIGVIMALACFALVVAHGTELVGRLERRGFQLSWAFGVAAAIAFLAAEAGHTVFSRTTGRKEPTSQDASELRSVKSQS